MADQIGPAVRPVVQEADVNAPQDAVTRQGALFDDADLRPVPKAAYTEAALKGRPAH